jgi:hypothetical protein
MRIIAPLALGMHQLLPAVVMVAEAFVYLVIGGCSAVNTGQRLVAHCGSWDRDDACVCAGEGDALALQRKGVVVSKLNMKK